MVLKKQNLRSMLMVGLLIVNAPMLATVSLAQDNENVSSVLESGLDRPNLGVTTKNASRAPKTAIESAAKELAGSEPAAIESAMNDSAGIESARIESARIESNVQQLPPSQTYDHNMVAYSSRPPVTAHHCGACVNCADRTGQTATMIGGLGIQHGLGPCPNEECQCWQCPYRQPFNVRGPGEYAGPSRTDRVSVYRLRTGDVIQFTFLMTPMKSAGAYRLVVGDELMIESGADEDLQRGTIEKGLKIQPDGTISLRLIGEIHAEGQSVEELRDVLNEAYERYYPKPLIDVTPVNTGTAARQVREAINGLGGFDSQTLAQTVTPQGDIRLPRIGSIRAQGLSLDELKEEINLRYDELVGGIEVEPSLQSQAPHYCFVLGEVRQPGRYNMDTPTTVLGAIALAGGKTLGANLRQVVIFRRGDNWELISTLVDIRAATLGRQSHVRDEIWIRDGDVIILPETPIELFNDFVQQVFTEGIYGVLPLSASYNFGDSFN